MVLLTVCFQYSRFLYLWISNMQLWISRLYVNIHSDSNFAFNPVLLYVYYCSVGITLATEFTKISWVWFLFFTYSTFTVIFCMNYQLQLWISRLTLTLFYLWLLNMATIGRWEEGRYELWLQNTTKDLYFSIWPQGGWEGGYV